MRTLFLVPLFVVSLFLSSCHQCQRTYICDKDVILISCHGFTTFELDSLFIEKYQQGSSFTVKIDSYSVVNKGGIINDTNTSSDGLAFRYLEDGSDYILKIPRSNREYKLYNIANEGRLEYTEDFSCGQEPTDRGCVNGIKSFYLDGTKLSQSYAQLIK